MTHSANQLCESILISEGRLTGGVDENGITYYNNLINELKANGKLTILNELIIYSFFLTFGIYI